MPTITLTDNEICFKLSRVRANSPTGLHTSILVYLHDDKQTMIDWLYWLYLCCECRRRNCRCSGWWRQCCRQCCESFPWTAPAEVCTRRKWRCQTDRGCGVGSHVASPVHWFAPRTQPPCRSCRLPFPCHGPTAQHREPVTYNIATAMNRLHDTSICTMKISMTTRCQTRSQAVARIADRTASQHLRGSRNVIGHVIIWRSCCTGYWYWYLNRWYWY